MKPQPMDDGHLVTIVRQAINSGLGGDQDALSGDRAEALDYYFGRLPKPPSIEGRSSARSRDVMDMIEALMAQIMPTFGNDTVATFEAQSEQDEQQAQIESDTVNFFIMEKLDGYSIFYESIKDALLLKNGIIKVYVDEGEKIEITEHEKLDDFQLQSLQAEQPDAEIFIQDSKEGTTLKRVVPYKRLAIDSIDPGDFVISPDQRNQNLADCKFCAHRRFESKTTLLEMGVPMEIVETIQFGTVTDDKADTLARNTTDQEDDKDAFEDSQKQVEVWESYIVVDYDGDGIGELRKVVTANQTLISNEVVPWIPFACGVAFINPHRWIGISAFDKLKDIADFKTIFLRQYQDNMVHHNNRRLAVVENMLVDVNEVINSRPGGIIRTKAPGAVQEIPVSDIGPSCLSILGYLDKQRTERVGASLDMQSQGMPSGNAGDRGIERQISFKEQMAGMITKTLAETLVKQTYLLAQRTLKAYFPESITVKQGSTWQQTNPQQWQDREHVSIDVGTSQGERFRQSQSLLTILQLQMQLAGQGMNNIITDASKMYNTVMDYCRMQGLDNPSQYWTDPTSPQSQQAAQQQGQQQQQQSQEQKQTEQQIISIEAFKQAEDARNNLRDFEFKIGKALLDSEVEEAKITGDVSELDAQQAEVKNAQPR